MSNILSIGGIFQDADWIKTDDAIKVGLVFASVSIIVSMMHILRHLKNYSMPEVQLYVIRILLTCPVYAVTSSIALTLGKNGIYAEVLRDVYEAVVVYSFMHLMLEYSGGETDCVYLMENEPRLRLPCPLCCLKPRARTLRQDSNCIALQYAFAIFVLTTLPGTFFNIEKYRLFHIYRLLRFCQRGVIQFILTQPSVAVVSLILLITGQYKTPAWQILQTIIYNISYAWALYCLYVFYLAIRQNIKNFRPIAKFASVKSIIFATYYQSLILKLMLADIDHAILWNDLLLCVEMVLFSTALVFAFPVSDFQGGVPDRRVLENVKDVFTLKDILHDVYHNFTSTYDDYALQRSETEMPANAGSIMKVSNRLGTRTASVQHMLPGSMHSGSSSHSVNDNFHAMGSPASSSTEYSQEYLESGQLNGKLGSVAQQMSERYRGRSKRLAFNALLRGSQPIKATLRPGRKFHHKHNSEENNEEERKQDENSPLNPLLTGAETEDDMVEVVFDHGNDHQHNNNNGHRGGHNSGTNSNSSVHSVNSLNAASNTDSTRSTSNKNNTKGNTDDTNNNTIYNSSTLGRLTLSLKTNRSPTVTPGTSSNNLIAWPKFTSSADSKGSSDQLNAAQDSVHSDHSSKNKSEEGGNDVELSQHSSKDYDIQHINNSIQATAATTTNTTSTTDSTCNLVLTTSTIYKEVVANYEVNEHEHDEADWGEFL